MSHPLSHRGLDMQASGYLRTRGETYWFRRKVPRALTGILGRREVEVSLRTGLRRVAEARARIAWAWTERAFGVASKGTSIAREQALVLLRRLARDEPWHHGELTEYAEAAMEGDDRHLRSVLDHASPDIAALPAEERNRVLLHLRQWVEMLDAAARREVDAARRSGDPNEAALAEMRTALAALARTQGERDLHAALAGQGQSGVEKPTVSSFEEAFLDEKTRSTQEHRGYSGQTAGQTRATLRLWVELMGDPPVASVGGKEAGEFRALLLRLPSSHGKSTGGRGKVRPPPVHAMTAIERADERERAGKPVERLSMKTTRRHFSTMQQLWKFLLQRGHVTSNPFAGFSFPGTKAKRSLRDDWAEGDLARLLRSTRLVEAAREGGRDFWLVAIAMWSGMRLEEICRLRPGLDVRREAGVPVFFVQEQEEPAPWSPKTEAGERAVPIHRELLRAGLLDHAAARAGQERLVPGLVPQGPDGKLGAGFSRAFSRLKTGLGVGERTVFHSFRHSVSTILRNEEATIREPWIDAVLGHDGDGGKSQGIAVYLKRIGVANLARTVEAIAYPDEVRAAWDELVAVRRQGGP